MKCLFPLLLALTASLHAATMSRIEFRQEAPDVVPGSFAALPKILYQCGAEQGRVEERPDPAQRLTGLMIANGKDGWMINLWTGTGRHFIDPSSTHNFSAPIVPPTKPNAPPPVKDFTIGHEVAFMLAHRAAKGMELRQGKSCPVYTCSQVGYTLKVYVDPATAVPQESDVLKDGKLVERLIYLRYELSLPADPALFQPPAGVKIAEAETANSSQK